jgi:hypothetical protein
LIVFSDDVRERFTAGSSESLPERCPHDRGTDTTPGVSRMGHGNHYGCVYNGLGGLLMDGFGALCAAVGFVLVGMASGPAQTAAELKPGDPAPAFTLPGSDGRTYSLADFKGKQVVVIAWFPKAFTGG